MPNLSRLAALVCVAGLLAGCQVTGARTGATGETVTPNAVAGAAIEVTALDDLPGDAAPKVAPAGTEPAGTDTAAPQADPPAPDASEAEAAAPTPAPKPAPKPEGDEAPAVADVPAVAKSDAQVACEKKRGTWSRVGSGSLSACVFQTRDGGKQCKKESDCDGQCLARSGTCAPIKPLFGCNEVLQQNGARVTLCIE